MSTGRPTEFSTQQIIAAGEKLLQEDKRVTGFSLRKNTGGGDPSRLLNVWETHLKSQEVIEAEPIQELPIEVQSKLEELTASFSEQFKLLATGLNSTAVNTAEQRVAHVVALAEEQQEKAKAELIDATETVNELEAQLEQLHAENLKLKEKLQSDTTEKSKLAEQKAALEQKLAVSQAELRKTEEANASLNEKWNTFLSHMDSSTDKTSNQQKQ